MTPTTALGLSIRLSMFELRETGDWDIFLGPTERARAENGGAEQWVLKRRKCSGFARVNKVTSASLGYPLSVFNTNSTLKPQSTTQILSWIVPPCQLRGRCVWKSRLPANFRRSEGWVPFDMSWRICRISKFPLDTDSFTARAPRNRH